MTETTREPTREPTSEPTSDPPDPDQAIVPDDLNPTTRYEPPAPALEPPRDEPIDAPPIDEPPAPADEPPLSAGPPLGTPAWQPPAPDQGRTASILFGFVMLGVGLWFFADQTLGLELPRIRWSQLWPLVLIVIGAWIAFGSIRRGSR